MPALLLDAQILLLALIAALLVGRVALRISAGKARAGQRIVAARLG